MVIAIQIGDGAEQEIVRKVFEERGVRSTRFYGKWVVDEFV